MRSLWAIILGPGAALSLTGCSTLSGGPQPLLDEPQPVPSFSAACLTGDQKQSAQAVLAEFECTEVSWLSNDNQALKIQRNNVVTLRLLMINRRYDAWERRLVNETREGNFGSTLALLGLSGVGSVIKQGATSRSLATSATVVTGAREGFNRDILLDRTIAILMTQMRASRAKVKETILKRLGTPYEEWPIGLALADLEEYEHAGTVNSALMAVAENAAIAKQVNEDRAENAVRTTAFDDSSVGAAMQSYLEVDDDAVAKIRIANFLKAAKDAGVPLSAQQAATFAYGRDPRKVDVLIRLIALEKANSDPSVVLKLAGGLPEVKEKD